ncbi:cytochrome c [Chryseobacterium suipulveris]|uniref:Cytochrome c n=1 Tax=Chryseobacterium suipulveris TaxID=2929800 RepID=A0ABY4BRN8_9FLAO|nr:cbb3-type cytochrome c oxidase subunit II [Chryseobacterium suipulveris]UOE40378.1 cytochrome c [Chryseobacterium suipulveris]
MEFYNNHKLLFWTALLFFLFLTLNIAILPAIQNQQVYKPLPDAKPLTKEQKAGKALYVENGCIACHTQQVRGIDMDKPFGNRPNLPADYAMNERMDVWQNTANLLGSERTGPDLTNIGERQPSIDWHLLHLYQPRAVVEQSVMPAYPWLFVEKDFVEKGDIEVKVPAKFLRNKNKKIVATKDALNLVAYLQALKQVKLPDGTPTPEFLYKQKEKAVAASGGGDALPDGGDIYNANCVACHQANGEGLAGAFPPLKGSPIVLGEDLKLYVTIIMKGYDARPEYATMTDVGTAANFTPEMVAALINHERTSWGNQGKKVTAEEVKKIMDEIK